MQKLILRNYQSPGDVVLLTAAVRDLHLSHPLKYATDVRTSAPALWEHNPFISPLDESEAGARVIECEYPLIHQSNERPYHFIHGFRKHLSQVLGVSITPARFRGDIYLSAEERGWMSQVEEIRGLGARFWVLVAGGKLDYTAKWWPAESFQRVVDLLQGVVLFVQVGERGHYHPEIRGAVDLRGRTDLRQLVRLVYHSDGVVCPVTMAMHLAAAVETKPGRLPIRPCVVIAGGREPPHWEAYPGHSFMHTVGLLKCCATGGCWRARTVPLGDGDEKDAPGALCTDVRGGVQACMRLITPEEVANRIRWIAQLAREYERGATPTAVDLAAEVSDLQVAGSQAECP